MSSFIGHTLAALTIGGANTRETPFRSQWLWNFLLVAAALAPDVDYAVQALDSLHNGGVRITHSILFVLIFPVCVSFALFIFDRRNFWRGALMIALAGLSHLLLDLLVGSREADPYFYPFFDARFVLPVGILPSSAKVSLSNYYFYRNLLIEMGVLLPVSCFVLNFAGRIRLAKSVKIILLAIFTFFLIWAVSLNR